MNGTVLGEGERSTGTFSTYVIRDEITVLRLVQEQYSRLVLAPVFEHHGFNSTFWSRVNN